MIKTRNITTWMMDLLNIAKERGKKVEYDFNYWKSYYEKGMTPKVAFDEALKSKSLGKF